MSDEPNDARSDEPDVARSDEPNDARSDEAIVDEFVEQRGLDDESWIEDGDKYRCPECEAVHGERGGGCRVCGWHPE